MWELVKAKEHARVMQNKRFEEGNRIPDLDWSQG